MLDQEDHDLLIKIAERIESLVGVYTKLGVILAEHSTRLASLEGSRNWMRGVLYVAGVIGTTLLFLLTLLGIV